MRFSNKTNIMGWAVAALLLIGIIWLLTQNNQLEEINKKEAEEIGNIIQEEINKVAGALKTPSFSKWLSKAVKARIKEIHPDIAGESQEATEFVNAWNVIKKFIERGN